MAFPDYCASPPSRQKDFNNDFTNNLELKGLTSATDIQLQECRQTGLSAEMVANSTWHGMPPLFSAERFLLGQSCFTLLIKLMLTDETGKNKSRRSQSPASAFSGQIL